MSAKKKRTQKVEREKSTPKTTRPEAILRRSAKPAKSTEAKINRTLDAVPDRIDVRDWFYRPGLTPLPDQIVNCDLVPEILDQGEEGACTGFALAAVINYLLASRHRADRRVSPRMLYDMARRYDEWPGENYSGSSARGAMKGWVAHGVCTRHSWPEKMKGAGHLTPELAKEAQLSPGGAYYRVMHRQVRDMHAALHEVGILYLTLMVHAGWDEPVPAQYPLAYAEHGNMREISLPVISRKGSADDGHAVAIVGYTADGFIIQNSWGEDWGTKGFALLPYEDYLLHATDVWVAQLGVPVTMDLWTEYEATDSTAGLQRASSTIPLADIRPYVIDVGNNGRLSDSGTYWTTEEDLQRLFNETIPKKAGVWPKKRILLYLHGGLNDEKSVARRIVAFRDVFLENEIYPLHIMWESGAAESINGIIRDHFTDEDERAGGAIGDWLRKAREGLIEAKDRTLELTLALPGSALWGEMKENARLASRHPDGIGGVQLLAKYVQQAMAGLNEKQRKEWELHIVAHSAGSIFAAHALPILLSLGVALKTMNFLAPAITIAEFEALLGSLIRKQKIVAPGLFVLSDAGELDDTVGPYGKSLLYLVSNAFEGKREVPLLGMKKFLDKDPALRALFRDAKQTKGIVVAGVNGPQDGVSRSDSHGGFDNDPDTLNSILCRILAVDRLPKTARQFTVSDLQVPENHSVYEAEETELPASLDDRKKHSPSERRCGLPPIGARRVSVLTTPESPLVSRSDSAPRSQSTREINQESPAQ